MQGYGEEEEWDVLPTPTQEAQRHPQQRGQMREYGPAEQALRDQRRQRLDAAQRQRGTMPPLERRGNVNVVVSQHASHMEGIKVAPPTRGIHVPDAAVYVTIVSLLAVGMYALATYQLRGAAQSGFLACAGLVMAGVALCGAYASRENRVLFWGCLVLAVLALALLAVETGHALALTPHLH